MERLRRALGWLERRVSRRGALALFLVALAVYALQSLAVPLVAGRDLGTYLRYYAQFGDSSPPLPMAMLFRTPVAPFAVGVPLDLGGAALAQVWLGLLYAASIVAWSATAAVFGARSALLTAALLLVFPGYGILFHALASDAIFAAVFAGWALVVSRATVHRSVPLFAAAGLFVGALALRAPETRCCCCSRSFRSCCTRRGAGGYRRPPASSSRAPAYSRSGPCTTASVTATTRSCGEARHSFPSSGCTSPTTSSARRTARRPASLRGRCDRELLPLEPYRSYGVDEDTFFRRGSIRMHEDLVNLSDRVWGWDSNYSVLRRAAWEALRAHPSTYAKGVTRTIWQELARPEFAVSSAQAGPTRPASAGGEIPPPPKASRFRRRTAACTPRPETGASTSAGRPPPRMSSSSGTRRMPGAMRRSSARSAAGSRASPPTTRARRSAPGSTGPRAGIRARGCGSYSPSARSPGAGRAGRG